MHADAEHSAATHRNLRTIPSRIFISSRKFNPLRAQSCSSGTGTLACAVFAIAAKLVACTFDSQNRTRKSDFATKAHQLGPVVNASVSKVFCSNSCALAEPVAGLALAERFTERAGMSGKNVRMRGKTYESAPIFAGSSCTHTISRTFGWRAISARSSFFGNG